VVQSPVPPDQLSKWSGGTTFLNWVYEKRYTNAVHLPSFPN